MLVFLEALHAKLVEADRREALDVGDVGDTRADIDEELAYHVARAVLEASLGEERAVGYGAVAY